MAWAMMKLPMNRKIVSSEKEPKMMSAGSSSASVGVCVTFRITHMARPMTAVMGMGMASVIQKTTTKTRTAARVFCE
jgi:hypothetical protein